MAAAQSTDKLGVTVAIPSFGGADTITEAVRSALSQNGGNVRVIVVIDDGCELSQRYLTELADDRITVIVNDRNLGAPASRNCALKMTATRYVSFLDADDRFEGDFLGPLIRQMEERQADVGFGPSVRWSLARGYETHFVPDFRDHVHIFSEWLGDRRNVNTASMLWRTSFVRGIGGWDTRLSRNQDGEIALRAILLGACFATSDEGAGVWSNDCSLPRITTRSDNLESLLHIVDKFLGLKSDVVPDELRDRVCARYCLTIAHLAYSSGEDEIGRQALIRRRALNVPDYNSDWRYVLSVSLRVIPRVPRLFAWRVVRKAREFGSAVRRISNSLAGSTQQLRP